MSTEPIQEPRTIADRLSGPTTRRLGWNPALDGARGASVLLVMSFHFLVQMTDQLDGTPILVDMFFVLSGFLITTLLLAEVSLLGRIDFGGFYLRRARRMLPALLLMLLGTAVIV